MAEKPYLVIKPKKGWQLISFKELAAYGDLFYFLVIRDIKVRYKQTVLGFVWAIIRPLFMMVVFTVIFGNLAKIPSEGVPYPLFSYAALLPWTLFAEGVSRSSQSLISNSALVQRVYCPKLAIPLSGILSPLVDYALAFIILIGLMLYFGYPPTLRLLWLPVLTILVLLTSLGVGLWLSALNVQYRDVRHAVPFLVQLWLYASPVVYASTLLPERFQIFGLTLNPQIIYGLNPMSGVIESFRWAIVGTDPPSYLMAVSLAIVILALILGAFYFRHREKIFADVV